MKGDTQNASKDTQKYTCHNPHIVRVEKSNIIISREPRYIDGPANLEYKTPKGIRAVAKPRPVPM